MNHKMLTTTLSELIGETGSTCSQTRLAELKLTFTRKIAAEVLQALEDGTLEAYFGYEVIVPAGT